MSLPTYQNYKVYVWKVKFSQKYVGSFHLKKIKNIKKILTFSKIVAIYGKMKDGLLN